MVDKLKGKLLLVRQSTEFGFMTFRLGDAFQRANKDVDMIVMKPGNSPYAIRRTWDYFVTHLLGKNPPKEFKLNMSHKA
jgi:dipeptidyl-peptidase-4